MSSARFLSSKYYVFILGTSILSSVRIIHQTAAVSWCHIVCVLAYLKRNEYIVNMYNSGRFKNVIEHSFPFQRNKSKI